MSLSGPLTAQPPSKPGADSAPGLSAAQLDRAAAEVLKEVHNRGADLYNRGDPAAAYRLYEGALSTVRPFVAHRPDVLKVIEDGLNETAKTDGTKIQAFRLHEVIEQVRASLKKEGQAASKGELSVPKSGDPLPPPREVRADDRVAGAVRLGGEPLPTVDVTAVSLDLKVPRVFTATADAAGKFVFPKGLPAGRYAVMVTGKGVPEKFTTVGTSPLKATVAGRPGEAVTLDLE